MEEWVKFFKDRGFAVMKDKQDVIILSYWYFPHREVRFTKWFLQNIEKNDRIVHYAMWEFGWDGKATCVPIIDVTTLNLCKAKEVDAFYEKLFLRRRNDAAFRYAINNVNAIVPLEVT